MRTAAGWPAALPSYASPQTRTFEATEFHRLFSGNIPPALHINPGDTVPPLLWTRRPRRQGVRRSNGGNPETGHSTSKARHGDTLAVRLNRIR